MVKVWIFQPILCVESVIERVGVITLLRKIVSSPLMSTSRTEQDSIAKKQRERK